MKFFKGFAKTFISIFRAFAISSTFRIVGFILPVSIRLIEFLEISHFSANSSFP